MLVLVEATRFSEKHQQLESRLGSGWVTQVDTFLLSGSFPAVGEPKKISWFGTTALVGSIRWDLRFDLDLWKLKSVGDFLGKTSIHTNKNTLMTPWAAWTRFPSCHWRGDAEDLCMPKPYVEDGVGRWRKNGGVSPKPKQWNASFQYDINGFYTSPIFRRKLFVWFPCSVFFSLEMPGSCKWSGWSRRREGMETVLKWGFPPMPMLAAPKIYWKNLKSKFILSRKTL